MAIRDRRYGTRSARDVHVLWGQTTQVLTGRVFVETVAGVSETLTAHRAANADFNYEFRPVFRCVLAGDVYSGFGINVDRVTGVVSFTGAAPPAVTRPNFILELIITQNVGGPAMDEPLPLRIHLHRAVTSLRVTPDRYRVRLAPSGDTYNRRFALRALFDDNVVGDISEHSGVAWDCPGGAASISGASIELNAPAAGANQPVTASYEHTVGQPALVANASLEVLGPWDAATNATTIDLIDGHPNTWDFTIMPEAVPNVLIVGAGYLPGDVEPFRGVTNKIVDDLRRDPLTSPYDRLATSMNYWRVMPSATSRGGKRVLCEVFTRGTGAAMKAYSVPISTRIRVAPAPAWTIQNLLYHVGLPIPAETSGPTEKNAQTLRAEWTAAIPATLALNVSDGVIAHWKELGTRQFVDFEDLFPVITFGGLPEAQEDSNTPLLTSQSGDEQELRDFCAICGASNNVALAGATPTDRLLGRLWADDDPTARSFNNRSLMVVIAATPGGRASRGSFIRMTVDGSVGSRFPVREVGGGIKSLLPNFTAAPQSSVSRDVWRTISHELGHSFGLDDEYVERPYASTQVEADFDVWGNTMSSAIRPANPGPINPADIKWNWVRARKGAVTEGPAMVLVGTTDVEVLLLKEHANQFAIGNTLLLRTRRRHAPLGGPLNGAASQVQQSPALTLTAKTDDQVMVNGNPVPGSRLKLTWPGVTAAAAAPFTKGSTLILPIAVKSGTAASYGPFKKIIAPRVEDYIRSNQRPLSPEPLNAQEEAKSQSATHTPPSDTYPLLFSFKNTSRIVGLYQGAGGEFALGVYRPAGQCMMRGSHADHEFCQACRYVMVDMIDPGKHWSIDLDYDDYYPE